MNPPVTAPAHRRPARAHATRARNSGATRRVYRFPGDRGNSRFGNATDLRGNSLSVRILNTNPGKCEFGGNANSGKCEFGEMRIRGNANPGRCEFGELRNRWKCESGVAAYSGGESHSCTAARS